MATVCYSDISDFLATASGAKAKISKIDSIIDALLDAMATGATTANLEDYNFDDGQSKLQVKYRSISAITSQISKLESLKNYYSQKLRGRRTLLKDVNTQKR